jgi:two-component system sensor histidine kinase VicK
MKSLKWKFVLMYVAVVFVAMIASGTYIVVDFWMTGEADARRDLRDGISTLRSNVFSEPFESGDGETPYEEMRDRLNSNSDFIEAGLEYYILAGTVPIDTIATSVMRAEDFSGFPKMNSNAVIAAASGGEGFYFRRRYDNASGLTRRYAGYAEPVFRTDEVWFILYARKDVEYVYSNIFGIARTIAFSLVIALIATGVLGLVFAITLIKPLANLTKKTKEFTGDTMPEEIPVLSTDEVGQLTQSFNAMAASLADNMSEIVREKNRNEIVLYNMTDGVLAYGADGGLIHCNNACYELLGFMDINDMSFGEMVERLGITLPEETARDGYGAKDIIVFINDKYLNAAYNPYRNSEGGVEGVIIVLQDITRHKKLDDMRKEFVANVSHEIRTPLTTIKSYSETLIEGDVTDRDTVLNFLQIINGETDRMMLLVNDLLELTRSDYNKMELNIKEIDLIALVEAGVDYHTVTAAKGRQVITFTTTLSRADVAVDPDRINQVLNNIISNSLKYSGENAVVNVSVEASEGSYRVYVRDNGLGIPKEDLARIFERFYRVDKARSRAMGGTGLGLSIAKEIMEAHGGRITAVSEFGRGTTMVLRLPRKQDARDKAVNDAEWDD